jgi:Lipocalin-like domain
VSYEARTAAGEIRYPMGQHALGQLFYDNRGNMSAHVMRVDRPAFASDDSGTGTDAEVRAGFEGHTSYFGTYTIDPSAGVVTHHVQGSSYPNWIGHNQIRYYRSDGSHLVLSTPPILFRGESLNYILTWERL